MAGLKVVVKPAKEPVTKEEVLYQLKYDDPDPETEQDIERLITAAREWCEDYQNRAYITQTLELALDCWPYCDYIDLPRPTLQSVTTVEYDGATWSAANYTVDDYAFVARIVRNRGVSWPSVATSANGIKIQYIAGYGDEDDVPGRIKQAIILLTTHWFENGMCDPPPAVYSLLNLDRVVPV